MKDVILAGGYGARISEETHLRPKPMVQVRSKPVTIIEKKIDSDDNLEH